MKESNVKKHESPNGLHSSTRQRTLSQELLGPVSLFSLAGSHGSCNFI